MCSGNLFTGALANSEDIMQHFIWVCTVCYDKNNVEGAKNILIWNLNCDPLVFTMEHPWFIVSNQNECKNLGICRPLHKSVVKD